MRLPRYARHDRYNERDMREKRSLRCHQAGTYSFSLSRSIPEAHPKESRRRAAGAMVFFLVVLDVGFALYFFCFCFVSALFSSL
jgi:hypothetical protein